MSFYQTLSKYYDIIFPTNQVQLKFLIEYARNKESILDIAAGSGNQAIELAKQGSKVTAIDFDQEMVKKIEAKSRQEDLDISVQELDMRNINQFKPQSYDLITCIGNSIVHLESYNEILETVRKMYDLLTDGGLLIIQIVNYDRILKNNIKQLPIIERENEGVTFIRTYEHQKTKIVFTGKLTVTTNLTTETFTNSVDLYPLTSQELNMIVKDSGFNVINVFGDFKKSEYTEDSPALVIVVQK